MVRAAEAVSIVNSSFEKFFLFRNSLFEFNIKYAKFLDILPSDVALKLRALQFLAGQLRPLQDKSALIGEKYSEKFDPWKSVHDILDSTMAELKVIKTLLYAPNAKLVQDDLKELLSIWIDAYASFDAFPPVNDAAIAFAVNFMGKRLHVKVVISPPKKKLDVQNEYDLDGYYSLILKCGVEGIKWSTLQNIIIKNVQESVSSIMKGKVLDHYIGSSFSSNLTIYVFREAPHAVGFVSRLKFFFTQQGEEKMIKFKSSASDIRFAISALTLVNCSIEDLSSIFVHEMVHALDVALNWESETLLRSVRNEGLAVFAELIEDPKRVGIWTSYQRPDWGLLRDLPLDSISEVENLLKRKHGAYELGSAIVMDLFLSSINEPNAFGYVNRMQELLMERKDRAAGLLTVLKNLSEEKFFRFYLKKVDRPIISKAVIDAAFKA